MKWIFYILIFSVSCQSKPPATDFQTWQTNQFISHDTWLAVNLNYENIKPIREQIDKQMPKPLQHRGESHITVITPPEFNILKSHLSMDEINKIAKSQNIQKIPWKAICIGQGSEPKNNKSQTFFIVIKSAGLIELRKLLQKTYEDRSGVASAFEAEHFHPHITLGFTDRDLHEQDGLIKDEKTCSFDLSTPEGKPLTENFIN